MSKKWKEILSWTGLVSVLVVLAGFTAIKQGEGRCKGLDITIDHSNGLYFVSKEDVESKVRLIEQQVSGTLLRELNTHEIEGSIRELPEVREAQAYLTIDGRLCISVTQRRPIARVIPARGPGFYIDEDGRHMPLSKNYAARVLVINGPFIERFKSLSAAQLSRNDSLSKLTLFDEFYRLAAFVDKNPFLKAQIQHAYVDENQEFTLIPRVGSHNIELGNTTGLEEKFEKLMVFYKEGLPYADWNRYATISLKFDNQVVCTYKDPNL